MANSSEYHHICLLLTSFRSPTRSSNHIQYNTCLCKIGGRIDSQGLTYVFAEATAATLNGKNVIVSNF